MDKSKLTVVETIPIADQQNIRSVIELLERVLEDARKGEILACAMAMVGPNQRVGYISSEAARHAVRLIGSVALMHHRICTSVWEELDVHLEEHPDSPDPAA